MVTGEKKQQMEKDEGTTTPGNRKPMKRTSLGHMYTTMTKIVKMRLKQ